MNNQKGFTLIELMIAMVIGLFLVGGVITVLVNVTNSTRIQENMAQIQENARFSLFFLNKDIRQAGYFGGPCVSSVASSVNNVLDEASLHYQSSAHTFDADTLLNAVLGADATGGLSDSITIKAIFDQAGGIRVADPMQGVGNDLKIDTDGFKKNSLALVTDCSHSDVFEVEDTPSSSISAVNPTVTVYSLSHKSTVSTVSPGNKVDDLSYNYQPGAYVYPLPASRNFVVSGGQLLRDGIPIADNVDRMIIYYGIATSGSSGAATYYTAYSNVLDPEDIVSIKIKLLIRSSDDNVTTSAQTYNFDNVAYIATDNRLRKEFVTTIALRNRID